MRVFGDAGCARRGVLRLDRAIRHGRIVRRGRILLVVAAGSWMSAGAGIGPFESFDADATAPNCRMRSGYRYQSGNSPDWSESNCRIRSGIRQQPGKSARHSGPASHSGTFVTEIDTNAPSCPRHEQPAKEPMNYLLQRPIEVAVTHVPSCSRGTVPDRAELPDRFRIPVTTRQATSPRPAILDVSAACVG